MQIETQANAVPGSPAKGIDVDKIQKELASMWLDASDVENPQGSAVTRACALNLLVYTTPWDDRDRLEDLLTQVNGQHPGRTLILVAYRDTPEPKLDAYVSMRCRLLGSAGKQICGEQITIEAGGPLVETAATAVAPLLVPDVPVYLWWKDIPHYEDKLFDRLSQMADRIVIDSAAFDHPYGDLLRLARLIADPPQTVRVSDLNWGRLTPWRSLLAGFWDVSDYRPALDKIDCVTIRYRPPQDTPDEIAPKALFLASWLSARLGWKVVGTAARRNNEGVEFDLQSSDCAIVLSFQPAKAGEGKHGVISSVALSNVAQGANFAITLHPDGGKLQTHATCDNEHSVSVLAYERLSEAERLSRELAFLSHDAIYEEAVARVAQLVATIPDQQS